MDDLLSLISPGLASWLARPRWLVGYSGGLDSTVLLHVLQRFLQQNPKCAPELLAVHIHHGLSSCADHWQQHCENFCEQRGIALACRRIALGQQRPDGLEAAARTARYDAINSLRQPGDVLFLGHHLDDQLETLVLNLFRSSGIAGLAGMAEQSHPGAWRARPLLSCSRAQLWDYAKSHELSWIEDESNQDPRFSRNFVRHRLLPMAARYWPDYSSRLGATMRDLRHVSELVDEVADTDLAAVCAANRWGQYLDVPALGEYSPARVRNMVRLWLHRCHVPTLRQRQWPTFFSDMLGDKGSAILKLRGASLRRHRKAIYFVADAQLTRPSLQACWNGYDKVLLGSAGALEWSSDCARGLDPQRHYQLAFRRGGEVFAGAGWGHTKSLKQYLQEQGVPPWWRDRVPLLVCDGQLAAVADFAIAQSFVCDSARGAARLVWQPAKRWSEA